VGLTNAAQSGVRPELLAAPVTGSVQGEVVQRRPPTAYMVDIERGNPDSPELDMVDIEREATLILLAAIAIKEGPTEGGGDAGGPGTAAGVNPQVAHGDIQDVGGPEEAAGGPDPPSGKDGKEGGAQGASGEGEAPSQEYESAAESGKKSTGAGEASAGGGGSDGEEGSGDGQGDDEGGGDGDAEMEMDVEHATVELNEKGECKRDPEFWAPPLKLPTGGSVYLERLKRTSRKAAKRGELPQQLSTSNPRPSSRHARSAAGSTPRAGPKWATRTRRKTSSCTWGIFTSTSTRKLPRPTPQRWSPLGGMVSATFKRQS
jgi:hypothetical protein